MNPQFQLMFEQALHAFQGGYVDRADSLLTKIISLDKKNPNVLHLLGLIRASQGNFKEAVDLLTKAAQVDPCDGFIQYNLAKALVDSGQILESIPYHIKAVELMPNNPDAWINYGKTVSSLKRYEEAIGHYDRALSLKQDYLEAWINKGIALHELKRYEEAIAHYDRALELSPDYVEAWTNKGAILHELKRYEEAIAHYDRALELSPDYVEAWTNKGAILHELKRYEEAIAHYDRALELSPDYVEAWTNKGISLKELKRYEEAIAHYDRALELRPDYVEALINKALLLDVLKNHVDSAIFYLNAFNNKNIDSYLLGLAHHQMMLVCNWTNYEKFVDQINTQIINDKKGAEPFGYQGIAHSERLLLKCAKIYSRDKFPARDGMKKEHIRAYNKIRIGYLCGEFRMHATSILMTRVWELHEKSKFEIFAFDTGWDDRSVYRKRIMNSFDYYFDISRLPDSDVAKLIKDNQIDVLINLNGYFGQLRQGVFAYKPAPIQVNYLGFPGTLGAPYIDYLIADKIVLPETSKEFYTEKIVYLPNSYQANDNQREVAQKEFSRSELGLPENSFIFCCFNNSYKITPLTFKLWTKILSKVPNSILWLLVDNPVTKKNLINEACKFGIDSNRLVFTGRLTPAEHLARHSVADLFLDTLPYNAHTTCSDALWSHLPVITLVGNTFPGRVSASLLHAIGMPELITNSEEEYEALAIALATDPPRLKIIKKELENNRLTMPLFDSHLFTKNIEKAYIKMYERNQQNLPPDHITID